MIKKGLFIGFCLIQFLSNSQVWTEKAGYPDLDRDDALALAYQDQILFFSGNHGGFDSSNKVYLYFVEEDQWASSLSFPGIARQYASGFVLGHEAIFHGGRDSQGNILKDVWSFNFKTEEWKQLADYPFSARWHATSFVLQNKGYIVGGVDKDGNLKDSWTYDLENDIWTQKAEFLGGNRRDLVSAVIRNKAYVGLGFDAFAADGLKQDWYEYEPNKDDWIKKTDYPGGPRAYAQASAGIDEILVCGGMNEQQEIYRDCYTYNSLENEWSQQNDFPLYSRGCSSASYRNSLYFFTGLNENNQRETRVFEFVLSDSSDVTARAYPNPSSDKIFIEAALDSKASLFSMQGELLQELSFDLTGLLQIDHLPVGIYLLRVESRGKVEVLKLRFI
jgi:N-acetylneuraminic acid mutarotase